MIDSVQEAARGERRKRAGVVIDSIAFARWPSLKKRKRQAVPSSEEEEEEAAVVTAASERVRCVFGNSSVPAAICCLEQQLLAPSYCHEVIRLLPLKHALDKERQPYGGIDLERFCRPSAVGCTRRAITAHGTTWRDGRRQASLQENEPLGR